MAEFEKKVREILKENGCSFVRHGKGAHETKRHRLQVLTRQHPENIAHTGAPTAGAFFC